MSVGPYPITPSSSAAVSSLSVSTGQSLDDKNAPTLTSNKTPPCSPRIKPANLESNASSKILSNTIDENFLKPETGMRRALSANSLRDKFNLSPSKKLYGKIPVINTPLKNDDIFVNEKISKPSTGKERRSGNGVLTAAVNVALSSVNPDDVVEFLSGYAKRPLKSEEKRLIKDASKKIINSDASDYIADAILDRLHEPISEKEKDLMQTALKTLVIDTDIINYFVAEYAKKQFSNIKNYGWSVMQTLLNQCIDPNPSASCMPGTFPGTENDYHFVPGTDNGASDGD